MSLPLQGSYRIPAGESRKGFSFLLGDELCILGMPPVGDTSLDSVAIPSIHFSSAGRDLFPVIERFAPTKYAEALEDYLVNTWGFIFQRAKWPLYRPGKFGAKPESGIATCSMPVRRTLGNLCGASEEPKSSTECDCAVSDDGREWAL